MHIATRMSRLGQETAFDVLARAKALEAKGRSIIHLEIGEPDFDTPKNIRDAAKKALDEGWTHYGPSAGMPDFKEAIAREISQTRNIKVEGKHVVVCPGAKPIMFFGVSKSGSPISRWMMLRPLASRALARAKTSKAVSWPSRLIRVAMCMSSRCLLWLEWIGKRLSLRFAEIVKVLGHLGDVLGRDLELLD